MFKPFKGFQGSLTPLTQEFYKEHKKMGLHRNNNISQDPIGKIYIKNLHTNVTTCNSACEEGPGVCALALTVFSLLLIIVSLPLSLFFVVKVVQVRTMIFCVSKLHDLNFQEYERAVIFRLGRLLTGGARGPGVFFVIPCVDVYEKIDMRSQTFEIPPQEVKPK